MKKADTDLFKLNLLTLRARLRGDVKALADIALHESNNSSMPIHMAELGSENYEQEFALSLMESEEDTLTAIDEALARIEGGAFGKCVECDGVIPKTRLNAIPYASMCVRCAEQKEGA
ncbi:RNA polymerase-binding transcription factor [Botrimarina colliarenosi]|uniref:RNA polymerase-binding transcription factor n=1 Tax=Botrimarina colliarenosi TaxID=2528001 RepID=A0A5C6ADY1_9BACT|nr:TraR/DksA family transcriptional regulator [Botrimarina colliarenosi]TWT97829.1 RNA polymerase-binding transcription factor [Botrimarina colliarenosi]